MRLYVVFFWATVCAVVVAINFLAVLVEYVGHWIDILRFSLQHLNMILYYQIGDLMENFMLLRLWDPL